MIKNISKFNKGTAFLLFGNDAKKLEKIIEQNGNIIITKPHPSPINTRNIDNFIHNGPFMEAYLK